MNASKLLNDNALSVHLMVVFRRAERTIRSHEGEMIKAYGLTPMQFGVLDVLYSKGPLSIGEIIEAMLSTSGNMTVVIRNMERDGYVTRVPGEDRRSYLISLTDKGRAKIEEVLPVHAEHISRIFSVLSEAEQKELTDLLRKFKYLDDKEFSK